MQFGFTKKFRAYFFGNYGQKCEKSVFKYLIGMNWSFLKNDNCLIGNFVILKIQGRFKNDFFNNLGIK